MGSLPAGCEHIAKDINQLRAKVEGLVAVALRGAGVDVDYETFPNRTGEAMIVVRRMPFLELNWINTYCKWERHARFVQKRLSEEAGNMTAAEQLAYSREIATASSNRDKWLEKLGLQPAKAKDVWDLIVATRQDAALIHQPPKAVMDGQLTTEGNGADSRPDLDLQTATDLRDANP